MCEAEEDKYFCVNYEDFSHICRVCLKRGSELLPIFNTYIDDISAHWILKECTKLEVSQNDGLPSNICTVCLSKLFKIHIFIKQSSLNDSTLRLILKSAPEVKYIVELCDNTVKQGTEQESPNNSDEGDNGAESEIGESVVINNLDYCDSYQDDYDRIQIKEEGVEETKEEQIEDGSTIEESNSQNYSSEDINEKQDVFLGEVDEGDISYSENSVEEPKENIEDENSEVSRCKVAAMKPGNDDYTRIGFQESALQMKKRKGTACEICHITTRKIGEHMRTHTKEKPFICHQCGKLFAVKANLRRHIRIHTGEKPHVCEQCGKAYTRTEYLRRHQKGHDGLKTKPKSAIPSPNRTSVCNPAKPSLNLSCNYCGCKFRRLVPYKKHLRKHALVRETEDSSIKPESEERPYLCDMCGKSFITKPQLDAHRIIHGERSFYCSYCEKAFHSKFNLNLHLRTHSDEKPYACSVCEKRFKHKIRLDTHVLIHTGEKPYFCNICGKRFRQSPHLMYHMRVHTGERPHICSFCGKSFAVKGNLKAHIRTHTGERPYLCKFCGKGFHDSSSRKKHQNTHKTVIIL